MNDLKDFQLMLFKEFIKQPMTLKDIESTMRVIKSIEKRVREEIVRKYIDQINLTIHNINSFSQTKYAYVTEDFDDAIEIIENTVLKKLKEEMSKDV